MLGTIYLQVLPEPFISKFSQYIMAVASTLNQTVDSSVSGLAFTEAQGQPEVRELHLFKSFCHVYRSTRACGLLDSR